MAWDEWLNGNASWHMITAKYTWGPAADAARQANHGV
jgi:hypothetical protein